MSQQLYSSVLRAMLRKATWMGVRYVALDNTFQDTSYRMLLAQVDKLHAGIADRDVTCDDLQGAIDLAYEGQLRDDLSAYVIVLRQAAPAHDSLVRGLIAKELAGQAAEQLLASQSGDLDLDGPYGLLERARDCLDGGLATPIMTLDQLSLPSVADERGTVIPLGLSRTFDEAIGGAGAGELIVIFAPPRRGKTTIMRIIGANMVRAGYNVLDITLETSAAKIGRLYERAMIHKRRRDMTDDDAVEARRLLFAKGGHLWLKDMSHTDVTPDSIEGLIRAQQRDTGLRVDAVILDYLELMAPARGKLGDNQMRFMYGRLGKQMRAVGSKFDIPIITGWQANREGEQKDTLTSADISECYDIYKHCDIMLALNRTAAEKAGHRLRLGLLKQREDDDAPSSITVHCDYGRMTIHDVEEGYAVHTTGATEGIISASVRGGVGAGLYGDRTHEGAGRVSIHTYDAGPAVHSGEGA